jgi:hypothetical protein
VTHFLLVYDQAGGRVLLLEEYADADRAAALDKRFALEREHADDPNLEVIVLSAPDRATLEATHARYFKDVQELASG